MDDGDLMRLHAETAFTYDARARMLCTNEPCEQARYPAPHLFLGRTKAGHVLRFGATVPDALAQQLEQLIKRQFPVDDLRAPLAALTAVREELARHAPITMEATGPAYRFPASIARLGEEVVRLTEANRGLVRETYPWLYAELADWHPCFVVVRDGAAVSVCFSSRLGVEAAAAGVETLPAFRSRGFATAVTLSWGTAVREEGRIPFYGTAWENLASQGVARRAGLLLFGVETTWV